MNPRRKLLAALGAGALAHTPAGAWPGLAQQPGRIWRIGVLALPNRAAALEPLFSGAFPLGMRDLGYVEGRNLLIE